MPTRTKCCASRRSRVYFGSRLPVLAINGESVDGKTKTDVIEKVKQAKANAATFTMTFDLEERL